MGIQQQFKQQFPSNFSIKLINTTFPKLNFTDHFVS